MDEVHSIGMVIEGAGIVNVINLHVQVLHDLSL